MAAAGCTRALLTLCAISCWSHSSQLSLSFPQSCYIHYCSKRYLAVLVAVIKHLQIRLLTAEYLQLRLPPMVPQSTQPLPPTHSTLTAAKKHFFLRPTFLRTSGYCPVLALLGLLLFRLFIHTCSASHALLSHGVWFRSWYVCVQVTAYKGAVQVLQVTC